MKFVLVHGAAHDGIHFEPTAAFLRAEGHEVWCPTMAGNRPGDVRAECGLEGAIASLVTFFEDEGIEDAVLVGHSWGGMVITGAADRLAPGRIRRLVYFSAFVPNDGECLLDMVPAHYKAMFDAMGAESGAVGFPFPVLREAFVNDGSLEQAQSLADTLNPHPYRCMADPVSLKVNPAAMEIGKSYLFPTEDTSLPPTEPFHPRLSAKLGLYRLVTMPGSHSVHHTAPELLARKIYEAGRD